MRRIEVEILSDAINNAVVKLPYRQFPAVLVPGDSLEIMYGLAEELRMLCEDQGTEEMLDIATELVNTLKSRLIIYEESLKANGLRLPYTHLITREEMPKTTEK